MMLVRQLAHLNFGTPQVRSQGIPFVAAGDDRRGRSDKREPNTEEKKTRDTNRAGRGERKSGALLHFPCPFTSRCYSLSRVCS